MVPHRTTRQRSGLRLACLCLGFLAVSAGVVFGVWAAAPATAATMGEPLSCPAMLDEATKQSLQEAGWELIDRTPQPGEDQYPFVELGGSACMWGIPQSGTFTWIAYSRISDVEATTQQARLSDVGFSRSEAADGTFFSWTQPVGSFENEARVDQAYLFADSFWYLAGAEQTLREVQRQVMSSLVVQPEPEPLADEPEPLVAVGLDSGTFDAPSTISTLPTAQSLNLTPERVGVTAGIAVVLGAIIAFPGKLVESALSNNYDSISRRLRPLSAPVRRWLSPVRARIGVLPRWLLIAVGLVVAAIISGFIDPQFGANPGSVRVFISVLLTLVVESVVSLWLISRLLRGRQPQLGTRFRFKFGSLIVLLLVVLASRATGFEPGLLFGVVVALSFAGRPDANTELRASAAEAGYLFGVGLVSWVAYSLVTGIQGATADAAGVFVREILGGLTIGALAALPIILLPWPGLIGGVIYSWRRGVWFGAYAVAILAFLIILLPLPQSWASIGMPFATWLAVYVAFAVVSIVVWVALTYGLSRPTRKGAQNDQPAR